MTTDPSPPRPAPSPDGREQVFDVRLAGTDPAALVRLLTTLRRRQCAVTRVDFRRTEEGEPGWLTIGIVPRPSHAHVVAAWLSNLVDVVAVEARRQPVERATRPQRTR
jgi:hypothetical protein